MDSQLRIATSMYFLMFQQVFVNYEIHSTLFLFLIFPGIKQKLTNFEESIGIEFTHIRLLARAFTDRSIGYTNLTLGSNQRLEFLGDTVLQLIVSEYLYKFFPEHHEGHLSVNDLLFVDYFAK